jgi:hypothetical protein
MEEFMMRRDFRRVFGPGLCLLAACFVFPVNANSQDQADVQKIYTDVAGTYEFVYEGQSLTIVFHVMDGRLYGREESGGEDAEIKPLDLGNLKFETTVQSTGQYYEIGFSRGENGKVNKCRLITGGVEIDGERVK